ncbi:MAG: ABC transporter permease [Candidatus Delongbacteria bacterium]|nr:ABC transporter permease [Candidatus Delongbacteria bacterium]MDD4204570.1 ABC transporter permease [Candidatus Delongbacteria bacterium]
MIKKTDINTLKVTGDFSNDRINEFKKNYNDLKRTSAKPVIDLSEVQHAGTLALAFLEYISRNKKVEIRAAESLRSEIEEFAKASGYENAETKLSFTDRTVATVSDFFNELGDFVILSADIFYYSIRSIFNSSGRRKGSVFEQMFLMGNNAVPIVFLLSFLIGLVLSLQSAAQLKQFGANIYLVDLIVIGMILEMGPILTSVIVAGRTGSAIAAEISTMKITEELDALRVMALNPLKYVVAPKMLSLTVCLPILTILANFVGIFGGFIVGVLYLDLSLDIFVNRTFDVMTLYYWWQSMLKSVLFSWLIVLIGAHFGFKVKGGSEAVGKAATSSVVASIFAIIMTDAVLSLIFYFEW